MWTPLLLICYLDTADCAVPVAPAFFSEQSCWDAIDLALETMVLPEGMVVVSYDCYNWGSGA